MILAFWFQLITLNKILKNIIVKQNSYLLSKNILIHCRDYIAFKSKNIYLILYTLNFSITFGKKLCS